MQMGRALKLSLCMKNATCFNIVPGQNWYMSSFSGIIVKGYTHITLCAVHLPITMGRQLWSSAHCHIAMTFRRDGDEQCNK